MTIDNESESYVLSVWDCYDTPANWQYDIMPLSCYLGYSLHEMIMSEKPYGYNAIFIGPQELCDHISDALAAAFKYTEASNKNKIMSIAAKTITRTIKKYFPDATEVDEC